MGDTVRMRSLYDYSLQDRVVSVEEPSNVDTVFTRRSPDFPEAAAERWRHTEARIFRCSLCQSLTRGGFYGCSNLTCDWKFYYLATDHAIALIA